MSVAAIMMVRDEADIIGWTVRHLLAEQVDRVYVLDNLSSDETRPILDTFDDRVTVLDDPDEGYRQEQKMTRLAVRAWRDGHTWIVPVDADELWYSPHGTLGAFLGADPPADIIKAWGWDHICKESTRPGDNPWLIHPWRRQDTQKLPKVAFRASPDVRVHMGNHDVDRPGRREEFWLCYRHLGYRSPAQMVRKLRNGAAAYRAAPEIDPMHGTHWRRADGMSDEQIEAEWWTLTREPGLVCDPCPWNSGPNTNGGSPTGTTSATISDGSGLSATTSTLASSSNAASGEGTVPSPGRSVSARPAAATGVATSTSGRFPTVSPKPAG